MRIAIVDYGSGNLRSAEKAFEKAAQEYEIDAKIVVTSNADTVVNADRVILPGVGAFADCYQGLNALDGMVEALGEFTLKKARPFLGICVGMQLLAERGLEHGAHEGLGWIGGEVRPIDPKHTHMKVPHMGWNTLQINHGRSKLFNGIKDGSHVYFVHSFRFVPSETAHVIASVDYGLTIAAALVRGNIAGTQFHPEKSQAHGLRLIANFLSWSP